MKSIVQTAAGELLWTPSEERVANAGLTEFIQWLNQNHDLEIENYQQLWQWSVDDVGRFWQAIWTCYNVAPSLSKATETSTDKALPPLTNNAMPGSQWFQGTSLNMAEYLLSKGELGPLTRAAIFAESECFEPREINWIELRDKVCKLATSLRNMGIKPGDRVVAYMPISIESIVALFACISVGAIWSSCSPDFGAKSVLERFSQINPKLLITMTSYQYNGKAFDRSSEVDQIITALPELKQVIHLPWLDHNNPKPPKAQSHIQVTSWQSALNNKASYQSFEFEQVPFEHPLWIMYTSGTTGMPKGIVHSQGGVLLELIKFAWLHDNLTPDSVKFFFTTTGWAMFNMLIGGFASGSALVVYDGCPTWPSADRLWDMTERFGITYFGISPTYINNLIKLGYSPKGQYNLGKVDTIAMGGSPVSPENFAWFYRHLHKDLHIVSMSGGTDVATAFVGGVPTEPVYAGEIQAPCLGVDACAWDENGQQVVGEYGELVIKQPMPSMPLCFWNDTDNQRYSSSYFELWPGVWRQGDQIIFNQRDGSYISGRSDSTLNRHGIRIGTSEIYRNVESISGIKDSLIINLELESAQSFMPIFIVLDEKQQLDDRLVSEIRQNLSENCSPRHIPDKVYVIDAVPYTLSGKKQEIPVKKLLSGIPLEKAVNLGACANPSAMDFFIQLASSIHQEAV